MHLVLHRACATTLHDVRSTIKGVCSAWYRLPLTRVGAATH